MIIIEFALGVFILALVVMGIVKLADVTQIVDAVRSWFKKDVNDDYGAHRRTKGSMPADGERCNSSITDCLAFPHHRDERTLSYLRRKAAMPAGVLGGALTRILGSILRGGKPG
jgi:hypothetical protein